MVLNCIKESRADRLRDHMRSLMKGRGELEQGSVYVAPDGSQFRIDDEALDFLPAPDLETIGRRLIDDCEEFSHLGGIRVIFLWKKRGGASQGQANLGKCQKTSGLVAYLGEAPWIIWLAADHVNNYAFTRFQVEALLHHEMSHAGEEEDEDGEKTPAVSGHDFDGFIANVKRYGAWQDNLKLCKRAWEQPSLFDLGEAAKGLKLVKAVIGDGLDVVDKGTGEVRGRITQTS